MHTTTVLVPAMACRHSVRRVTSALRDVPGVVTIQADAESATVVLSGTMTDGDVLQTLVQSGFPGSFARKELRSSSA